MVPDDISVVGFDDMHSAMYSTPPLRLIVRGSVLGIA